MNCTTTRSTKDATVAAIVRRNTTWSGILVIAVRIVYTCGR